MDDQTIEKLAEMLGKCATTGDSSELVKQAGAAQLILPLLSATAGGAAGYLGTQKEKNKVRNALYGALTGGLGGAGLQAAMPMLGDLMRGKSERPNLGGNPGPGDGGNGILGTVGSVLGFPFNRPVGTGAALAGLGAAERTGASKSVGEMLARQYDKLMGTSKHTGELHAAANGLLDTPRGKGVDDTLSKFFKDLFSKHGPNGLNKPVSHSLNDLAPHPGQRPAHPGAQPVNPLLHPAAAAGHPATIAAIDAYNSRLAAWHKAVAQWQKDTAAWVTKAKTFKADRDALPAKIQSAESLFKPDSSLGADPATRAKNFATLAEMHQKMTGKELPPRILAELEHRHKGPAGRVAAGRVGRLGTNAASMGAGYLTTSLLDWLSRYGSNLFNGPPASK